MPLEFIGLLEGKDVLVGAIDVATDRIETPDEVAATIRAALAFVPAERLYPCTNCGMVPLARDVARGKLRALAAGAAQVRRELAPRFQRVRLRGNPFPRLGYSQTPGDRVCSQRCFVSST